MSIVRWSFGVVVFKDKFYVIGGLDNREFCSNSVEMFDFDMNRWIQFVVVMNVGCCCFGVVVVNDIIYVVGGCVINSIEYYD